MRFFYSILFTLIITSNAVAAIKPEHQKIADQLLSGDLVTLKLAAKTLYRQEVSDPAIIDIAAEVLLRMYKDAYAAEIDTLAWVARAIGASDNGRYFVALTEVKNNSSSRKLVKYALDARDELYNRGGPQYQAGMYQLPEGIYARDTDVTSN